MNKLKCFTQYKNDEIRIDVRIQKNGSFYGKSSIYFKKFYNESIRKDKLRIIKYLGGKCHRCGLISPYPEIYDIHHINPKDKSWKGAAPLYKSFETIKDELDKCILLCSNCHRIIHSKED